MANTSLITPLTTPIAVIGAGSWGTALAILLGRNQQNVHLWDHDVAQVAAIEQSRMNQHYLPNIIIPNNVKLYSDLAAAIQDSEDIVIAVPSHVFRLVIIQLLPYLTKRHRLIWVTKGLDPKSGKMLHEVINELIAWPIPQAVLAGPSFALEVAGGLPTAVTVASLSDTFAKEIAARFHNNVFRVYTSADMIGVQIAGTVKNVLAVATGIADGLGFGANARSALITRGLAEMIRIGTALGGKAETFIGLAGVGDLVLTCTDNQSRNRRFGLAVGGGTPVQQAERDIGQVVEGARNTAELYELAKRLHVDMPITTQVYRILFQNVSPHEAVSALLSREPRSEKD